MSAAGVPTLLTHLRLSNATESLRRQSETARVEVATGRHSDPALKLGANAGGANLLFRALEGIGAHRDAIARANLRLESVQSVITEIGSGSQALDAEILAAIGRGDDATIKNLGVQARAALDNAVSRLNLRVEGRSLFAGDAPDRNALAGAQQIAADVAQIYASAPDAAQLHIDLDFYFNDPAGGFETVIYQGGAGGASSLSIAERELVAGSVKANDPAFKDVLRGLAVIATAGSAPASQHRNDALARAGASALNGSTALKDVGARLGLEQQRADAAAARLNGEEAALTSAYESMVGVDPYEAASQLQALENQTEASYLLTARLSRLSLANYL